MLSGKFWTGMGGMGLLACASRGYGYDSAEGGGDVKGAVSRDGGGG